MPCFGLREYRDTARWLKCRAQAAKAMLAEGWNRHARKFHQVQMRGSVQLYRSGKQM